MNGPFSLNVTVPANTTAKVFLPLIPNAKITEGGNPVHVDQEQGSYVARVGSGSYQFQLQ